MNNSNGKIWYGTGIDNSQLQKDADRAKALIGGIGDTAESEGSRIDNVMGKVAASIAVAFTAQQAAQFSLQIVKVRGEIQQLEIALDTMLGSAEKRNVLMGQLIESAAKTPFGLTDISQGAKLLLAYGESADKVNESLMMLGNIAAGLSIPLGDLVYLYGTTMVQGRAFTQDIRQFQGRGIPLLKELARQLNVTESAINEMVTAGEIGFDKIAQALQSMTSKGGQFENLMERQSKGIVGRWANIEDEVQMAMNDIGLANEDLVNKGLDGIQLLVQNYEKIGKVIGTLIITYGSYKAAIIAYNAVQKASASINLMVAASNGVFTRSLAAQWLMTEKLQKAKALLNKTILANPYALAAAAVIGLVTAITLFRDKTTDAEKAQKQFNDRISELAKIAEDERAEVEKNISTIKDETATRKSKQQALDNLQRLYPSIFANLDLEKVKNIELAEALKLVNAELEKKESNSDANRLKEIDDQLANLRKEHGTFKDGYDNDNGGQVIDNNSKINILLKERQLIMRKLSEESKMANDAEFEALSTKEKIAVLENKISELNKQKDSLPESGVKSLREEFIEDQITKNTVALNKYKNELTSTGKTARQEISEWLKELKALAAEEKKLNSDASITTSERTDKLADIEKRRKRLEDNLKSRGYSEKENSNKNKQTESLAAEENRLSEELTKAQIQREFNLRREKEALKKDGHEKDLALLQLDFEMKMNAIDNAQQEELNKLIEFERKKAKLTGAKFDPSGIALSGDVTSIFDESRNVAKQQFSQSQSALLADLLDKYKTYEEQRNDIVKKYKAERELIEKNNVNGIYDARLKVLNKEEQKSLSDFDTLIQEKTSIVYELFSDMRTKSIDELKQMKEKAEELLAFLSTGIWNPDQGQAFGLTEAQFAEITADPQKLAEYRNAIESVKSSILSLDNPISIIDEALAELFNPKNKGTDKMRESMKIIEDQYNKMSGSMNAVGSSVSDIFSSFGNDTVGEVANGIIGIATGAGQAAIGVGKIAAGDIIGGIKDLAQGVANVVKNMTQMHDAEKERNIQKLQDKITNLDKSYKLLAESIEVAYSKDASKLIEQQNVMLRQQQILIRQQIEEEKAKKRTDDAKIEEWENRLSEIDKQIENNKEKAIDAIFGNDVQSAIDNLADEYLKAWSGGEDKINSMKDVVRKMIRNVISEMVKGDLSGAATKLREQINNFLVDGIIDDFEQNQLDKIITDESNRLDKKYKWADKFMRDSITQGDATFGEYEKITQEQASSIDGRLTGLYSEVVSHTPILTAVAFGIKEMRNVALDGLAELVIIRKNTSMLSETNELLRGIKKGTDAL